MSDRIADYPARIWVPLGPDSAAGYERDMLGDWALIGLVIYGPTTDKLRGTKLRDLERPAVGEEYVAIRQDDPPGPELVAEAWATRAQKVESAGRVLKSPSLVAAIESQRRMAEAIKSPGLLKMAEDAQRQGESLKAWAVAEVEATTAPNELRRRDGEDPDEFYLRVARAHIALSRVTDKPTTELATRARVNKGTAAAWVSRAKARGLFDLDKLYPQEGEQ